MTTSSVLDRDGGARNSSRRKDNFFLFLFVDPTSRLYSSVELFCLFLCILALRTQLQGHPALHSEDDGDDDQPQTTRRNATNGCQDKLIHSRAIQLSACLRYSLQNSWTRRVHDR